MYLARTFDEFREQIRSTRNFACNPIITWLSGGLNYQIEHHLFPTLPRSILPKEAAQVQELARRHGESYTMDSLFKGYTRIYKSLDLRT